VARVDRGQSDLGGRSVEQRPLGWRDREGAVMFRDKFSDSEWDTVLFTPLWAFHAVAGVDGKVETAEAAVLAKEISEALLYKDDFAREVLSAIGASMQTVMPAYMKDSRNVTQGLMDAARILDEKMPGGAADGFKRAVLGICIETAKAAGPRFGDKVSKEEKAAIVLVAAALRVPIPT
jgi:hypothetical protein